MFSKWWTNWGSLLTVALPGLSYVVGYSSVAAIANVFGVTAKELGLDFRDYILLVSLNLVVWTSLVCFLVGVTNAQRLIWRHLTFLLRYDNWRRRHASRKGRFSRVAPFVLLIPEARLLLAIGLTGCAIASAYGLQLFTFGGVQRSGPYFVVVYLGVIYFSGASSVLERRVRAQHYKQGSATILNRAVLKPFPLNPITLTATAVFIVLSASAAAIVAGAVWAADVKDWAAGERGDPRPPVPLSLVMNPETGKATDGDISACVARVGGNVYIAGDRTIIREMDAFSVENCDIDPGAFAD